MRTAALTTCLLGVLACGASDDAVPDSPAAAPAAAGVSVHAPTPPVVGRDLRPLQWIVGEWRGTGAAQAPFYERYRLADDSTLIGESFTDSTFATVGETTRYQLRSGALTSVPGATGEPDGKAVRWYASALADDSVRFEPLANARNSFVWRGVGSDEWSAVLTWPATSARPARPVLYTMRRVK
jgi:hypothetical protein